MSSARPKKREQDRAHKISLQFWKTGYLDLTKTKEKQLNHSFNMFLQLLLTISWQLLAKCLSSLLVFASLLHNICSLTETMSRKFQGSDHSRFGGSEKDCYFLKFPKWQHKLVWNYKRGKLVSYFLNNAAKT